MNKQRTAKLYGVIRDGLNAPPYHTTDCEKAWAGTPGQRCTQSCIGMRMRLDRALTALDQLEAGLPDGPKTKDD